jgi:hypothetical protein
LQTDQTFPLDDTVLITLADTDTANEWIQVTEPGKPGAVIPPPPPPRLKREEAITWEKVIEYANDRPLLELHLVARTPAGARELALLAQPLGADELAFSVKVEGALKQRGIARFLVTDVGLNHPTKPIDIAQTLYNALERDSIFEADLVLKFGAEGRTGLEGQLQTLAEASSEDVTPRAIFNKPLGKTE